MAVAHVSKVINGAAGEYFSAARRMEAANGDSRVEHARTMLGGMMSNLVAAHGDSYLSDGAG